MNNAEAFLTSKVKEHYQNCPMEHRPDFGKGFGSQWGLMVETMMEYTASHNTRIKELETVLIKLKEGSMCSHYGNELINEALKTT